MFETSQQEPSGHDTKIIAGVIVVIMVVLGIAYYIYIHRAPAATQTAQGSAAVAGAPAAAGDENADPMRDLSIVRFNLGRDQTQTMALWDLQLSNRSRVYAYKNIQYATNYYDNQETLLYHNEGTIQEQMDPGDQRTINQINDGLYPVGVTRYTIEIKGAEAVQP